MDAKPIIIAALTSLALAQPACAQRAAYQEMIATHAKANDVPEALVHRVVIRESKYNAHLIGRGATLGLMQIKLATARGVGYQGNWEGLLDPETNIAYGVRYLAGAWRISHGSYDLAVKHYARGYYYDAKRMGLPPITYASLPLRISPSASSSEPAPPATNATYTTASTPPTAAPAEASVTQPAAPSNSAPPPLSNPPVGNGQELLRQAMINRALQKSQQPPDEPETPAQDPADVKVPGAKPSSAKASAKTATVPVPRPRPERAPVYRSASAPSQPNALAKLWDDLKRSLPAR